MVIKEWRRTAGRRPRIGEGRYFVGNCARAFRVVPCKPKMLVNRKFDGLAVLLLVTLVGCVLLQPGYRLQVDPPQEFLREAHLLPVQRRTTEEKIARAYWKCAVTDIQWRYGYTHRLPSSPPAEFAISGQEFGPAASDPERRSRYWKTLQQVWHMPSVWKKEYDGNFRSIRNSLQAAGDWLAERTVGITSHP